MKEENNNTTPRREKGHGPNFERPKNFKQAISRLFKSLSSFKVFIFFSLVLAMAGAILSLVSPVIAFVGGASPKPISSLSVSSLTITSDTASTVRNAVLNGVINGTSNT